MDEQISLTQKIIFALMVFSFLGWYTAEMDNEVLRKELSHYKGEEIRR